MPVLTKDNHGERDNPEEGLSCYKTITKVFQQPLARRCGFVRHSGEHSLLGGVEQVSWSDFGEAHVFEVNSLLEGLLIKC